MKSDIDIKTAVIASIRKKFKEIDAWTFTRFWEAGDPVIVEDLAGSCNFAAEELPILYSYIDADHWMLFTTRQLCYCDSGKRGKITISHIADYELGMFTDEPELGIERLSIRTTGRRTHRCPYPTGLQLMVILHTIQTLRRETGREEGGGRKDKV